MDFNEWFLLRETSLNQLYDSTVDAFPRARKRQNAIHEIDIRSVSWTPYKGVRTLFAKGFARNEFNGMEYNPIILFKRVNYHDSSSGRNVVEITANNGLSYYFEKISHNNDVLVRCNCKDFYWRFNYEDKRDQSLWGRVRAKYEAKFNPGASNPLEMPGMCKHLIKLAQSLSQAGILED
jgi:hypothetical protein